MVGNISDDMEELEGLVKRDKKKIKKLKKRLKGNIEKLEELQGILDQMLEETELKSRSSKKSPTWNPISECFEIIVKGKMISFFDEELISNEKPNKPYYLCEVEINYPNGTKGKIRAYMWATTTIHHNRLVESGASIWVVLQRRKNENFTYAKVIPPRIDITEFIPEDQLDEIRKGTDYKPFTHEDKWWNRIPT